MEDEDDEEEITMTPLQKQESDTFDETGDIGLGNDPIRLEVFPAQDHSDLWWNKITLVLFEMNILFVFDCGIEFLKNRFVSDVDQN